MSGTSPADERHRLRAREGVAISVSTGDRLRITNLGGGQVVDTWALAARDPTEWMSMEHTRTTLAKLVPAVGDPLYSCRRRPILRMVEDTSPGVHDTLLAACDEERYLQLGHRGYHASCAENYARALAERGLRTSHVPCPLNLFMNIPWDGEGQLEFRPAPVAAGDYVTLGALIDVVVVLSACPMDLNPINGGRVGDIGVELFTSAPGAAG